LHAKLQIFEKRSKPNGYFFVSLPQNSKLIAYEINENFGLSPDDADGW
jgi:hypothetical protein